MRSFSKRIGGALAFTIVLVSLASILPLLRGTWPSAQWVAVTFLVNTVIGYLAWPWMESTWANRDATRDRGRATAVALGAAAGILLPAAFSWLTGRPVGEAATVVLPTMIVAALGISWLRARRVGRR